MDKRIIILYGRVSNRTSPKQQMMIDGGCTCGYREFAEKYGEIIYLSPQKVSKPWERCLPNPKDVVKYIKTLDPNNVIIWSVKYDPTKDAEILSKIKNYKTLYYSCCSRNMYNSNVNISLVDDKKRLKKNCAIHIKGKNPDFWKAKDAKEKTYDYVLVGRRGDKNELFFIEKLNKEVKEQRKIIWIGGVKFADKVKGICSRHRVKCTDFVSPELVRDTIPKAHVGILFTEHPAEGFPQTLLEMSICGVPVMYNYKAPINKAYNNSDNTVMVTKKDDLVIDSETLLKVCKHDPKISQYCREEAIANYGIAESYQNMLNLFDWTGGIDFDEPDVDDLMGDDL